MEKKAELQEIYNEVKAMNDQRLKEEYSKLSEGLEYELSRILSKGTLEGHTKENHSALVLALLRGSKEKKYQFMKSQFKLNPYKEIPCKRKKKTVLELLRESYREYLILEEIAARKLY